MQQVSTNLHPYMVNNDPMDETQTIQLDASNRYVVAGIQPWSGEGLVIEEEKSLLSTDLTKEVAIIKQVYISLLIIFKMLMDMLHIEHQYNNNLIYKFFMKPIYISPN